MQFGRKAFDFSQVNRLYGLARIYRTRHYDVVHAHFGMVGDRYRFVKELWGAPLIVNFHGFDVSGWPKTQGRNCYAHLFEEASAFVVNSEHLRKRALGLGCPSDKIVKIPATWDITNFPYAVHRHEEGTAMRVLTVARLVEKKGVEDAIAAIALVRKTYPDVHYDVVGDGPLRARTEALIDALDLRETVTLHGAQSSDYVRHMMDNAHVFLLPSVTSRTGDEEGLPVSLLEAQSAGLPIVSTLHAGIPEEVVHGETGFLVPEHAPEQLAHWLVYLANNPQVAEQMGQAARDHVERNFAPERIDASFVDVYERVIDEFRAQREHKDIVG
jgi:colanic acid/amylovoran biosynthesis glycosyltransferase